jgi:hypothetical protein
VWLATEVKGNLRCALKFEFKKSIPPAERSLRSQGSAGLPQIDWTSVQGRRRVSRGRRLRMEDEDRMTPLQREYVALEVSSAPFHKFDAFGVLCR